MNFQGYQVAQYNFTGDWKSAAKQIFIDHDRDGSGTISMQEFPALMSQLAQKFQQAPPRQEDCWYLMHQYDTDKNGIIDINEFNKMLEALQQGKGTGTHAVRNFR